MVHRTIVSACIVTYNNAKLIEKVVESLISHTKGVDLKLYIVDNASSDNTVELLSNKFNDIHILQAPNNGFGAGHNVVLPMLDSEYHAIINPDIFIREDIMTEMADHLDKNPDIGMLSPRILYPDSREQILGKKNPSIKYLIANRLHIKPFMHTVNEYTMQGVDLSKPIDIEFASGCFMFIRTSLFKQLNGFDEKFFLYFEDADLTRRVNERFRTTFYPHVSVYHEWSRAGAKTIKMFMLQMKSATRYLLKWSKLSQQIRARKAKN